jgi:2-oxo-3-hexenedioate decarboxylase
MSDIAKMAQQLDQAAVNAKAIPQLSADTPVTLEEAYQIQAQSIDKRIQRGESLIGVKVGFTSRAKMIQMGVDDLIWGRLTDAMLVEDGGELDLSAYVHPRVEPEIAFLLKKPLSGKINTLEAMSAIEAVAPAMEIIDSRYENFKFSLEDVVADNSSSSGFVIGAWQRLETDIANLGMVLEFNGRPVQIGSSAAILGHPIRALLAVSRLAEQSGLQLEAGWIVLAGAATAAQAITPDTYMSTSVENMGFVSVNTGSL